MKWINLKQRVKKHNKVSYPHDNSEKPFTLQDDEHKSPRTSKNLNNFQKLVRSVL